MITRLKVRGFKNLKDIDVEFGPFTCIAGANAVGKSNLFDAIKFLGSLATESLIDAVKKVRSEKQKATELKDIFFKSGDQISNSIYFEVDLIIPSNAEDDLGEIAVASITSVKYILEIKLENENGIDFLEIVKEELAPISQQEAKRNIKFENSKNWKNLVIKGRRSNSPFISTDIKENQVVVRLHQDQTKGKPFDRNPSKMGRTALSTVSAEYPTAYVVKEEFRSWKLLQLEPTSLRKSDDFESARSAKIEADGSHIPATISKLISKYPNRDILQEISNRLLGLIEDVREVRVDRDEKRQLLTLILKTRSGSEISARNLSDGTLRFLALTIIEEDPDSGGLLCLEEPENGIHPGKIKPIIRLLNNVAFFNSQSNRFNNENPIRQVIVNTHSPLVVQEVPEESLLIVESEKVSISGQGIFSQAVFRHLSGTWRDNSDSTEAVKGVGKLLNYLSGIRNFGDPPPIADLVDASWEPFRKSKKVKERDDVKRQLELFE